MLGVTIVQEFELAIYSMITSKCKSEGAEGATVYGINSGNDFVLEDVSARREEVELLIELLHKHYVSYEQAIYVVEDYIAVC